jgi:hypothetical protein
MHTRAATVCQLMCSQPRRSTALKHIDRVLSSAMTMLSILDGTQSMLSSWQHAATDVKSSCSTLSGHSCCFTAPRCDETDLTDENRLDLGSNSKCAWAGARCWYTNGRSAMLQYAQGALTPEKFRKGTRFQARDNMDLGLCDVGVDLDMA